MWRVIFISSTPISLTLLFGNRTRNRTQKLVLYRSCNRTRTRTRTLFSFLNRTRTRTRTLLCFFDRTRTRTRTLFTFFDRTRSRTRTRTQNRTPRYRTTAPKTAPAPKGMLVWYIGQWIRTAIFAIKVVSPSYFLE